MTFANLKIHVDNSIGEGDGMPTPKEEREFIEALAAEISEKDGIHGVSIDDAPDPSFRDGERDN